MSQQFDGRPPVLYKIRQCSQNEFDIIVSNKDTESKNSKNSIIKLESADVKSDIILISIIIPNYNKAKYLDKCLESVINQSYKNWKKLLNKLI